MRLRIVCHLPHFIFAFYKMHKIKILIDFLTFQSLGLISQTFFQCASWQLCAIPALTRIKDASLHNVFHTRVRNYCPIAQSKDSITYIYRAILALMGNYYNSIAAKENGKTPFCFLLIQWLPNQSLCMKIIIHQNRGLPFHSA